ncbi:hypothetical protein [Lacimicrobium alkaliphilum]|uniref:Prepilin peptidase dependent protein B n=1 Tax=Lacimicrobium alkaliphilum TaxID=1526571 RepID=A0ABQ1RF80_9ALTE|nr:hypothetical protein [Lacimicrobium alkaliphilum]GGD66406.1 hypothetical protein GCM10011357_22080 [Lacimicrobium alkaliphilum]
MLEKWRQRGGSLVELMISMLLGMASLSMLASVTGYSVGTNAKLIGQARLTEEMRAALFLISREVRRAGLNGDSVSRVQDPANKPSEFASSIVVGSYPGEMSDSCILFSYDMNLNGQVDKKNPNERLGFRLKDGAIEVRQAGASCDEPGWQDLTDSQMLEITSLSFSMVMTTSNQVTRYYVDIDLLGQLSSRPEFNRRYQQSVMVRAYD